MQTTRARILSYLDSNHQATAPQLAALLDKTEANVRYHLNILLKEGQIEFVGQASLPGAGRPTHVYMLSKESQEHGLDNLASALLDESIQTNRQKLRYLQNIADKLVRTPPKPQKSITIQLGAAVQRLNELKYKAHWEAHLDGPRVLFAQCPYAKIIHRHPELCEMDELLLTSLTGVKCRQEQKISRTQAGKRHCQFILSLD